MPILGTVASGFNVSVTPTVDYIVIAGGGSSTPNGVVVGGAASPSGQGNVGGVGIPGIESGAGGGGAGAPGSGINPNDPNYPTTGYTYGGDGTNAQSSWLTVISQGVSGYIAGGGGGSRPAAPGGAGGGGYGGGTSGTVNTGGGGGGQEFTGSQVSGTGGSGLVSIRYPDSYPVATSATVSPTTSGGYRYYTWTANGSITF